MLNELPVLTYLLTYLLAMLTCSFHHKWHIWTTIIDYGCKRNLQY